MTVRAKKIEFHFEDDMSHCVHDVISYWLRELDEIGDKKCEAMLKQKIIELGQVINRTGKPQIHFKNRNGSWEKVIIE